MQDQYAKNEDYQVLNKFATNSRRTLSFNEKLYKEGFMSSRAPKFRTEVSIPNNNNTSFFASLYDTYYREGEETQFSGTFITVSEPKEFHFTVRKRNVLDKINGLFGDQSFKTLHKHFDAQVVIEGNDDATMAKFLCNSTIQKIIIRAFKLRPTMIFSLNHIKINYVDALKNEAILGLHESQWFMKSKEIEHLFDLAEQLKRAIK